MTSKHLQNGGNPSASVTDNTNQLNQTQPTTLINQKLTMQSYMVNGDASASDPSQHSGNGVQIRPSRQNNAMPQQKRGSFDGSGAGDISALASVSNSMGHHHQRTVSFDGLDENGKLLTNGDGAKINTKNPFTTHYAAASKPTATGRTDVYSQISAVLKKHSSTLKNSGSSNELSLYGAEDVSSVVHPRPQRPHSVAVSSAMMMMSTLDDRKQPISLSTGTKLSHSTSLHHTMSGDNGHIFKPIVTYGHFSGNSPARMINSRSTQEFSMYAGGAVSTNSGPTIIPPVVQRRSHSTPRPVHGSPLTMTNGGTSVSGSSGTLPATVNGGGIPQRPRSLDRTTIAQSLGLNLMEKKTKPPPIPSRRFSQPPAHSQANGNMSNTSTPQRTPVSQMNGGGGGVGGMRQSITFHGQMNRHAANGVATTMYDAKGPPEIGPRRKQDRPLSYAYGTLPDQDFLENQLKMYSEQLKTITETVRKYSEQAKLLSELKRQQAQQHQSKRSYETLPRKMSETINHSSADTSIATSSSEPSHASHAQLKLFLDGSGGAGGRRTPNDLVGLTHADRSRTLPRRGAESPARTAAPSASPSGAAVKTNGEPKTPSDQLRQFLDAIRSNQLPEESADDLSTAATRFSKFKENLEKSRPKSLIDFDRLESSATISESFNQFSDNLRIMNQDLESLGRSPIKQTIVANNKKMHPSDVAINQINAFGELLIVTNLLQDIKSVVTVTRPTIFG